MTTKYFTVYDSSGNILRSGQAPEDMIEAQAQTGEFVLEGQSDPETDIVDVTTKNIIAGGKPPEPINMDYRLARFQAYPNIGEQLDMLWHAMDRDEIPKAEPFYSTLKAVKLAYPPDNSVVPGSAIIYRAE